MQNNSYIFNFLFHNVNDKKCEFQKTNLSFRLCQFFLFFNLICDRKIDIRPVSEKIIRILIWIPVHSLLYISFKQMVASCKNDWTKEDCLRCKGAIFGLNRSNSSSKQYITFFLKVVMRNKKESFFNYAMLFFAHSQVGYKWKNSIQ